MRLAFTALLTSKKKGENPAVGNSSGGPNTRLFLEFREFSKAYIFFHMLTDLLQSQRSASYIRIPCGDRESHAESALNYEGGGKPGKQRQTFSIPSQCFAQERY